MNETFNTVVRDRFCVRCGVTSSRTHGDSSCLAQLLQLTTAQSPQSTDSKMEHLSLKCTAKMSGQRPRPRVARSGSMHLNHAL
jgi:hypothetical protein